MTDSNAADPVVELARHLEATGELPLERSASRVLGEAEAVASDAAAGDLDAETVRERVRTVRDLLGELDLDGIEHDEARAHVEAALERCADVLEENGSAADR
ncbi:hypothetical protein CHINAEXTREME_13125 [Halobiforma lacisalsi AJ5]|uniref:DUF8152 domain-containing protein n=1 Tax=Natronobacterium lacisalsi AJ5 TaxID=358396 RepID=M0LG14_NATLA|nr:hypothetical protein [Halobiforma lacisalsi]APW98662.1 hypothetical protein CHINAEXTREME_13125 [Halobiforma lacisalsi AJ5]EMA32532.1 hypothetical protein C445_10462 [Halobiforma lacisalsi AJ5]